MLFFSVFVFNYIHLHLSSPVLLARQLSFSPCSPSSYHLIILLLCFLYLFFFYSSILSFISWIIFHTIRCVINQSFPHRLPLANDSQVSSLPATTERCPRTADKAFYIHQHTLTDIFCLYTLSLEEEKQAAIIIMFNY